MDLSEVQDVFFEECLEGLDVLESGLLNLDQSTDIEEINAIFRAAHSIKGGAGTFGFPEISAFTHVMETLLDEMRDGRRAIEREAVDRLLASVDVLRGMVDAAQEGVANDEARVKEVQAGLEELLAQGAGASSAEGAAAETQPAAAEPDSSGVWQIDFAPGPEMLKRGNEPLRIFRELGKLGELSAHVDTSSIPELATPTTGSARRAVPSPVTSMRSTYATWSATVIVPREPQASMILGAVSTSAGSARASRSASSAETSAANAACWWPAHSATRAVGAVSVRHSIMTQPPGKAGSGFGSPFMARSREEASSGPSSRGAALHAPENASAE